MSERKPLTLEELRKMVGWWNQSDVGATLRTPCCGDSTKANVIAELKSMLHWIVRRLTPTECERLQGYPDGWTDIGDWVDSKGKRHKAADSPKYKALGNSIALTPVVVDYLQNGPVLARTRDAGQPVRRHRWVPAGMGNASR